MRLRARFSDADWEPCAPPPTQQQPDEGPCSCVTIPTRLKRQAIGIPEPRAAAKLAVLNMRLNGVGQGGNNNRLELPTSEKIVRRARGCRIQTDDGDSSAHRRTAIAVAHGPMAHKILSAGISEPICKGQGAFKFLHFAELASFHCVAVLG